jgi:hypothetical protein
VIGSVGVVHSYLSSLFCLGPGAATSAAPSQAAFNQVSSETSSSAPQPPVWAATGVQGTWKGQLRVYESFPNSHHWAVLREQIGTGEPSRCKVLCQRVTTYCELHVSWPEMGGSGCGTRRP